MRIIAHRGYSAAFPENTALAFEQAIAAGADMIETDVRLTRDGCAVCWHDADLQRVVGDPHAVADLTREEFCAVPLPLDQFPLTLESVLALARGRVRVMLDVKIPSDAMLEAIVAALDATRMAGEVVYGVRRVQQYRALRRRVPQVAVLAMPAAPEALPDYLAAGVIAVRLWEDEADAGRIARIHAAQRQAWVTAGLRPAGEAAGHVTAPRAAALARLGADALLVNDPRLARTACARAATARKAAP
jgi:glycerophosphoryl diester phosphodiesterase